MSEVFRGRRKLWWNKVKGERKREAEYQGFFRFKLKWWPFAGLCATAALPHLTIRMANDLHSLKSRKLQVSSENNHSDFVRRKLSMKDFRRP